MVGIYFITEVQSLLLTDSFLPIWNESLRKKHEVEIRFNSEVQISV
jgi:hypothetical protein